MVNWSPTKQHRSDE